MSNVKSHIELLGLKVKDRVTGMEGIVTSICFDLYGCIQAALHPGMDKDGKPRDQNWFDVSRLEVTDSAPVMERPNFEYGLVAEAGKGPADKMPLNKA